MLVSWRGSGGWWVRNVVAKNNNYGFETHPSKSGDELIFGQNKLLLKYKICRQNFIWLLIIPLYLPHPFIFLPSWHSQVQGQQWALITSKSYKCVVFIFEYLTLNHTPLLTKYNCLQEMIQSYIFVTSENQTTCFAKSVKPNSIQRKRHQMALFKNHNSKLQL